MKLLTIDCSVSLPEDRTSKLCMQIGDTMHEAQEVASLRLEDNSNENPSSTFSSNLATSTSSKGTDSPAQDRAKCNTFCSIGKDSRWPRSMSVRHFLRTSWSASLCKQKKLSISGEYQQNLVMNVSISGFQIDVRLFQENHVLPNSRS
jgi:hypothetical protein